MTSETIYYKDLIAPDDSITGLISQLEKLSDTYGDLTSKIKKEANTLANALANAGAGLADTDAMQKAAMQAERLKAEYEKLKRTTAENSAKIYQYKEAIKEANTIARLEAKLAREKEGSYNHLSAQYSLLKIKINQMTEAERNNTVEGKKMVEQAREIYEVMDQMQRETGKFTLNVGNYANSVKEAITDITGELNSNISQVLGGQMTMREMLNNTTASAVGLGRALLTLMANPAFLAITGAAGAVAAVKFWWDYNTELEKATRLTKQFTGLSGGELSALRDSIATTAEVFDKDFNEVLRAAVAYSDNFGVSYKDAIKAVNDGFISGADARGEFLEDIKEYSAYFKEAGIAGREFIAISAQTNTSGIFSDKGVDTIKEGNIRLREMTKATREALDGIGLNSQKIAKDLQSGQTTTFKVMQEVSAKLSELPPQAAAVGTAIADIFGGPGEDAGLKFLTSLKDIETNLDKVKGRTGEIGRLQEENIKSTEELKNVTAALFDSTGGRFEQMKLQAKLFANDALVSILKRGINITNWFIDLYNKSLLFRQLIKGIGLTWSGVVSLFRSSFTWLMDSFGALGEVLAGVITLDPKRIVEGLAGFKEAAVNAASLFAKDVSKAYNKAVDSINDKIEPIVIPVIAGGGEGKNETMQGGAKQPPVKVDEKAAKEATKKADEMYKIALEVRRRYEDEELKLNRDKWKRLEKEAEYSFSRQIEDIKYRLNTEKELTEDAKKDLINTIPLLEAQLSERLKEIAKERKEALLQNDLEGLKLRLDAVREGTEEEFKIKRELIEKEKELALLRNENLPQDEKQSAEIIAAGFAMQAQALRDEYYKAQLDLFDIEQEFKQSEFDLLQSSEYEKTRFRISAEMDRIDKILALNELMGAKLTDMEVATFRNQRKALEKELKKAGGMRDLYEILGLKLTDKDKQNIAQSTKYGLENLQRLLDARVQEAEKAVEASKTQVEAAQNKLNQEIENSRLGYANNVVQAQKELDLAKATQEKAEKQREKAVKRQQALDSASQASSLITATANIWKSATDTAGIWGTILAVAATALMWGSFLGSKIKAKGATGSEKYRDGTVEMLEGGSHVSGNDIYLGNTKEGKERRAEGGEFFAVVNKRSSKKYRKLFPEVIRAFNNGTFHKEFSRAFEPGAGGGVSLNFIDSSGSVDTRKMEGYLRAIKTQGEKNIIQSDGVIIEVSRHRKRTIKNG